MVGYLMYLVNYNMDSGIIIGLGLWLFNFQQYSSFIVAVSFIGGGNRSTRRKSPTSRKSLTLYHVMLYEYISPMRDSNSQR